MEQIAEAHLTTRGLMAPCVICGALQRLCAISEEESEEAEEQRGKDEARRADEPVPAHVKLERLETGVSLLT